MSKTKFISIELPAVNGQGRHLYIYDLPNNKSVPVTAAATINESLTLIMGENGKVYAAGRRNSSAACSYLAGWSTSRLKALARLGVLSASEVKALLLKQEEHARKQAQQDREANLRDACKALGIPVPKIPKPVKRQAAKQP